MYSYTKEKWGSGQWPYIRDLSPDGSGILYRYPGNRDLERHGAAALCKLIYPTEDPGVKKLHPRSIYLPEDRFSAATDILNSHIAGVELNGRHISISSEPLLADLTDLPIPDLRYGRGAVLHVKRHQSDAGVEPRDYPKARMQYLLDSEKGYWDTSSFRAQFLLLPMTLDRKVAEGFKREFQAEIGRVSRQEYTTSEILYDDSRCRSLYQYVQEIKGKLAENGVSAGYVLLVLPSGKDKSTIRDLHNFLKKEMWPQVQFQCARSEEIATRHPFQGKARSYLRYLALGMLLVNRKWPFVLATPLNYEVYVGIDVLNGRAGFTFLYRNGEECYFHDYRSRQPEKLTTKQIRAVLYKHLKEDLLRLNLRPKAIVVHRDGLAFDTEVEGMKQAFRTLQDEGYLDVSARLIVVEIHKTSALPIRIARELPGKRLVNPGIGTYRVVNGREGLVCTTGYPFNLQGTARPLHCRIVYGEVELEKVLQDVFSLSPNPPKEWELRVC